MKASYITAYGGLEVIKFGELPEPEKSDDRLLVEVKAAALNPIDYKIREGMARILTGPKFPKIIGADFAGVIKHAGGNINGFAAGERVYGNIPVYRRRAGALAELVSVKSKEIRRMPDLMTFEQAASLPIACLTAISGVKKLRDVKGKSVLLNGASGGVGLYALQLLKSKGAIVTAACSRINAVIVKSYGADAILDYNSLQNDKSLRAFDAIFDVFGKMDLKSAGRMMKKGGVYASTLFFPYSYLTVLPAKIFCRQTFTAANFHSRAGDYAELEALWQAGVIKPVIENIFRLENARDAFELLEHGKPRGKVLVQI